jgi:hypothetical protein
MVKNASLENDFRGKHLTSKSQVNLAESFVTYGIHLMPEKSLQVISEYQNGNKARIKKHSGSCW